jgi:hypothetical protein
MNSVILLEVLLKPGAPYCGHFVSLTQQLLCLHVEDFTRQKRNHVKSYVITVKTTQKQPTRHNYLRDEPQTKNHAKSKQTKLKTRQTKKHAKKKNPAK